MSDAIHFLTIEELGAAYRAKQLSPVEATQTLLDRIQRFDGKLNAFRLVTPERALAAARASEARFASGQPLGPLDGIPYATKDLFDVAGLPTTAGSKSLEGAIANTDATTIGKLARAGMVLAGKTNTVEFAFGSAGINHSHGTPHNPWSAEHHVPGGSSSGSAVAVAAGFVPFATGTDTGCSVRTPAALCGTVGLKTTVGRVSRRGVFTLSPTLDSVGPLTRSVRDAALLLDVLQGKDPGDPSTAHVEDIDALHGIDDGVRQLRIGVPEDSELYRDLDPEVEKAVREATKVLESLGANVESMALPEAAATLAVRTSISSVEGATFNRERLEKHSELLDPAILDRMGAGLAITGVEYVSALREMERLRASMLESWGDFDVLVLPTVMIPAAPLAVVDKDRSSYQNYARMFMRNSHVGNWLGLCGVTVPCGFTSTGMPIGFMVYGKPFREDMALRVAQAYEAATSWRTHHPDIEAFAS